MRSELDKSYAGAGTHWAFYEKREDNRELYRKHKVLVRLPYDFLTKEERANLSGEVKTYPIEMLDELRKNDFIRNKK